MDKEPRRKLAVAQVNANVKAVIVKKKVVPVTVKEVLAANENLYSDDDYFSNKLK